MTVEAAKQSKRELILDAALRIIARDGLRGLTYRSVASEANVPLGLTTYYFKGIESLYIAAYEQFVISSSERLQSINDRGLEHLTDYQESQTGQDKALSDLVKKLSKLTSDYVYSLVTHEREYRLMSMAFIHAAMTIPEINELVRDREKRFNHMAEDWFTRFGSANPSLMADLLVGLVNHTEHRCLLGMNNGKDKAYLKRTMAGFFDMTLRI